MKNSKMFKRGFTLLELLVVVAIIGILSSVVIFYLNSSKREGDATAVKTNLHTISNQVGLYYLDHNNSYGQDFADSCPSEFDASSPYMFSGDKAMYDAVNEAVKRGNGASYCYVSGNNWAVAVGLKSDTNTSWCVDSEGASKLMNFVPASSVNNGVCAQRTGGWCGDGKCGLGETKFNCPRDCRWVSGWCGDGKCGLGETKLNCPSDCGITTKSPRVE